MKFLKWSIIIILTVVVLGTVVGLILPKDYDFNRSVVIDAPPEAIHAILDDLRRWPEWEPWKDADPTIEVTFGEKTTGVGAHQSWTSKDGKGELTITKSDPQSGIEFDMAFIMGEDKRIPSVGKLLFTKEGNQTRVTWSLKGNMDIPVVGGFLAATMDKAAGAEFEKGLAKLKRAVETKK